MRTVARLVDDHRLIERVCDAFTTYGDAIGKESRADDPLELQRFVAFLRGFSDGSHHRKEQDVLFPSMIAAGLFPPEPDPETILAKHDNVRTYASVFADFAARPRSWKAVDRDRLGRSAHGYVELLRQHFQDEETFFYPLAENHLSPAAKAAIDSSCERLDGAEDRALRLLGEDLVARHRGPQDA